MITPLSDDEMLTALKEVDAIRSGHFALTSGRHSDTYVQCARFLEDPALTMQLAATAVHRLPKDLGIDLVAAPAVGGVIMGFAVAQVLGVKFIFSERKGGIMQFRRGFTVPAGARVLVVEDVVTTGGSVGEVIDLVRYSGGTVAGVVSIIDRGGDKKFDAPFWPLLTLEVESWDPPECVLCGEQVPVTSPGSRRLS